MDIKVVTIKEETAIPNEQQLTDNIIRILAKNNLSISEAKEILRICVEILGIIFKKIKIIK